MDEQFRKSALTIGRRMAALSGAMVVLGAALFSGALWWKATHGSDSRESTPHVTLSLDVVDLAVAFAVVGIVAVAVAGGAAFFFTRQATQPLELAMERQRNFIADASHELRPSPAGPWRSAAGCSTPPSTTWSRPTPAASS